MNTLFIILAAAAAIVLALLCIGKPLALKAHDALFNHMARSGLLLAMTTLAVNKLRDYQIGDKEFYPVIAADIIYEGAAVGENASGYARPLVAGDPFLGFAERQADNSLGLVGAINVEVKRKGSIVVPVAGASAVTANDRPLVYASDDDTFTLTASTNSIIGRVQRWISGTTCVVEFNAALAAAEAARVAGDA